MTRQEAFNRVARRDPRSSPALLAAWKMVHDLKAQIAAMKRARAASARGRMLRQRGRDLVEVRAFV